MGWVWFCRHAHVFTFVMAACCFRNRFTCGHVRQWLGGWRNYAALMALAPECKAPKIQRTGPLQPKEKESGSRQHRNSFAVFGSITDSKTAELVAEAMGDMRGGLVIEAKPGDGVFTRALLKAGAREVIALEPSHIHQRVLKELHVCQECRGKLKVSALPINSVLWSTDNRHKRLEHLRTELLSGVKSKPWTDDEVAGCITGVAPHSTSFLLKLFTQVLRGSILPSHEGRFALSFLLAGRQAEKILATPGSTKYGNLSLLAQLSCEVESSIKMSPSHVSFGKTRKKKSSIPYFQLMKLIPRKDLPFACEDVGLACNIIYQVFVNKSKPILNYLQYLMVGAADVMKELGLPLDLKPIHMSPADVVRIINRVTKHCNSDHHNNY